MAKRVLSVIWFDGHQWTRYADCRVTDSNTVVLPDGEIASDLFVMVDAETAVLLTDRPSLLTQADFQAARRRVIFSSLWANDSDLMSLARNAMAVASFVLLLVEWFSVNGLSSQIAAVAAKVVGK